MQALRLWSLALSAAVAVVVVVVSACEPPPPPRAIDPGPMDHKLDQKADPAPTTDPTKPQPPTTDPTKTPPTTAPTAPPGPPVAEGPADVDGVTAQLVGRWDAEVRLVKGTAHQMLVFRKDGTFDQEDSGGERGTRMRSGRFFIVGGNPQKFQMELGFDGSQLKSSSSWGFDKEGKLFTQVRQDSPVVYTKTPTTPTAPTVPAAPTTTPEKPKPQPVPQPG